MSCLFFSSLHNLVIIVHVFIQDNKGFVCKMAFFPSCMNVHQVHDLLVQVSFEI